ncbi:MAG: M48 family metalloprotease [Saprospiraceae bacterium]|nr:M48 family metalloprotease [Saprospiraceae bacterium]
MLSQSVFPRLSILILTIFIISSCARNPVTGKKEFMLMSESQEKALGAQSDPSIIQAYGLYENQELQDFINIKGQEMVKVSHRPDLEFSFRLLDSPVVNAFAVPGGYVYFTRGIMAHFNNEAEFAGVLGHEIGHVTARHSAKQYSQQMLAQVGFMAGVIASEKFREFAYEASQGLSLLFLKFGRDHESQSDELGVEYSTKVGYDSHEMADFFQTLNRLQSKSGQTIPDFLSTHPNPVNRYNKVHKLSDQAQANLDKASLKIGQDEYLSMIDGLVYGDDPKQGYTDNNVFYHPVLLFQFPYPAGWNLLNAPTQVQMAPKDGKALMILTLSSEKSLDQAAQAAAEQFNLAVIESQRTNVKGNPAIAMVSDQKPDPQAQQAGQQTDPVRILSYFIQYGEYIYVFHGLSLKADFNKYNQSFKRTMTNFRKLTDQSRINVKPTRINIKAAPRTGTLKTVLNSLGVAVKDHEEISIINGMKLTDNVSAGTKLKLFSQAYNK